jgi:hypothetical protein
VPVLNGLPPISSSRPDCYASLLGRPLLVPSFTWTTRDALPIDDSLQVCHDSSHLALDRAIHSPCRSWLGRGRVQFVPREAQGQVGRGKEERIVQQRQLFSRSFVLFFVFSTLPLNLLLSISTYALLPTDPPSSTSWSRSGFAQTPRKSASLLLYHSSSIELFPTPNSYSILSHRPSPARTRIAHHLTIETLPSSRFPSASFLCLRLGDCPTR